MEDVSLISPKEGEFHKFQYWFALAFKNLGYKVKSDVKIPRKVRAFLGRVLGFSLGCHSRKKVIILGCHRIESVAWPWCWIYEIIPVMWDLWPENFGKFIVFLKRCRVKLVFVTALQNVELIHETCPWVKAIWLPEGINASLYTKGSLLRNRTIDVLNYGRNVNWLNESIKNFRFHRTICHIYPNDSSILFKDFDSLVAAIKNAKMAICYPQCDTNPIRCGNVETLTQRYWECMLCGTLMIGRAPHELITICGYNPVITLDENPVRQIDYILRNIDKYQELVDKNRICAENNADWIHRIPIVVDTIMKEM